MRRRRRYGFSPWRALVSVLCLSVAAIIASASTASNTVPGSSVGESSFAITAETLKPSECSGITLSAIVTGSGAFSGTAAAELVLASSGNDGNVNAGSGADCILGGAGNDNELRGQQGNDVINGGPGTDVCRGGPGADTFLNCESTFP